MVFQTQPTFFSPDKLTVMFTTKACMLATTLVSFCGFVYEWICDVNDDIVFNDIACLVGFSYMFMSELVLITFMPPPPINSRMIRAYVIIYGAQSLFFLIGTCLIIGDIESARGVELISPIQLGNMAFKIIINLRLFATENNITCQCCARYTTRLVYKYNIRRVTPTVVPQDWTCRICLTDSLDHLEQIQCMHVFHRACLDEMQQYGHYYCPICRCYL